MSDENEDKLLNIFTQNDFEGADGTTVPVVVETGEGKRQVGEAKLTVDGQGVHASVYLKNDDPDEVVKFLRNGLTGISIADAAPDISEAEAQAIFEFDPHDHKPVQHRDARAPWCDFCGLGVDLTPPKSTISGTTPVPKGPFGKPQTNNFGFPKPSRLHDDDGSGAS